ncbi:MULTISPECIES: hypothetical protein [unclassified Actinotalea]|uniref:hypothetical protein n=1 Tax=unclassified Actinotalea TaxID=2638618 RepID=UPI0015F3F8D8|nr:MULTISPECIES: hypothetical protein [unclassified Actinotalea]
MSQSTRPPLGGRPATGRDVALAVAGIGGSAVVVFFLALFVTRGDARVAVGCAALLLVVGGGSYAWGAVDRARRRRRALAEYGSFEGALARLDVAQVRAVRERDGEVAAVRDVRRQLPHLSLPEAVEIARDA